MNVAVAVVAFAGGVLAWAAIGGDDSPNGRDQAIATNDPTAFTIPFGELPASSGASRPPVPASDGGAPSAIEAVEGFLQAEASERFDESFLLLSTADRTTYRSAARWTQAHQELPPIIDFEITTPSQSATGDRVEVVATLELEPALNEIVGLVPAGATATWVAVREGEVWRLSLGDSVLAATWPSEDGAPQAVRRWTSSVQDCAEDEPVEAEWTGGLLDTAAGVGALCDSSGAIRLGPTGPLDPVDATPFIAAFGEDVVSVARVIPVRSPVELRAVVAPLGDNWLVVGTLPPPP